MADPVVSKGKDVAAEIMARVNDRIRRAAIARGEEPPKPEDAVEVGDFPIIDAIYHARGPQGAPVVIQTGALWPASKNMVVAFIFERDESSYNVYALPNRLPNEGELLGPRRYTLRLDCFSFAAELLADPDAWSNAVVGEILDLLGEEDVDDEDEEDDDGDGDDDAGGANAGEAGSEPSAPSPAAGAASVGV